MSGSGLRSASSAAALIGGAYAAFRMAREPSRLSAGNQGSKRALSFMAATMSMAGFDTASCVHLPRMTPLAQSFRFSGKIQEKIQEKHFKEKSALHAPSVAGGWMFIEGCRRAAAPRPPQHPPLPLS